jgi:hypothetical protein
VERARRCEPSVQPRRAARPGLSRQGTPAGRITTSEAIVPSDSPAAARASTKPASKYHRHCRGRWRGVLSKGFGPDGRRKRYKVSGRTKQDVIEALKKKKSEELDAGLSTSRSYKVEAAAYDWLEHGLPGRSERTRELYRDALALSRSKICFGKVTCRSSDIRRHVCIR